MGFVVGYALCGLSPQIDGMPVILKKRPGDISPPPLKQNWLDFLIYFTLNFLFTSVFDLIVSEASTT